MNLMKRKISSYSADLRYICQKVGVLPLACVFAARLDPTDLGASTFPSQEIASSKVGSLHARQYFLAKSTWRVLLDMKIVRVMRSLPR